MASARGLAVDHVYRYQHPSQLDRTNRTLRLATSTHDGHEHPHFFTGQPTNPERTAKQELCIELDHGVSGAQRRYLEGVTGTSKVAKAAKALFATPIDEGARMQSAANQLVELRIAAARRWA